MDMDYYASNAELYDLVSPGAPGDVDFYREEAERAGSPILELACGTGRILLPLARAGLEITGVDISQPMLSVARRKIETEPPEVRDRIRLLEGDMRDFSLGREFNLALVAYSSFLHMITPEEQRKALLRIREHLGRDGRLIISMFDPRIDIIEAHTGPAGTSPRRIADFVRPDTGRRVIVWDSRTYNLGAQTADQYRIFEELDDGGRVTSTTYNKVSLRWSYRWEMQYLFELCGYEVEALYSDFHRSPFTYGNQQVWVVRPSGRSGQGNQQGVAPPG